MKKMIWALALLASVNFISCADSPSTDEVSNEAESNDDSEGVTGVFKVDLSKSSVNWTGTMLKMYHHFGTVDISEGTIELKDGKIAGGSFTIDLSTINPMDDNFSDSDGGRREDLIGHLQSDDFFNTKEFPDATFTIGTVKEGILAGNLAVRGVSQQERVTDLKVIVGENNVTVGGSITFNRQSYGVSYQMGMADMVISDEISCKVKIFASK